MPGTPIFITDTELSGNLKRVYSSFRTKLFPISVPLIAQIKKEGPGGPKNMKWGGAGVYFDTVTGAPVGWTASTAGYLPDSTQTNETQGSVGIARMYVSRVVDALAVNGTSSKQAAYVALRAKILDEIDKASQLGLQEMLHGDGSGVKAIVNTVTNTTTITAISPYGYANAGQGGMWLLPKQPVAVVDSTGTTVRGRSTISTVTHSGDTATVTFSSAIAGMTSTDVIVACTQNDTAINSYPNGLGNILNRSGAYASLHGISSATYDRWNSTRLVAGTDVGDAAQPNELDVWDLAAKVGARSGISPDSNASQFLLLTTKGIERKLIENQLGQRRYAMGDSASSRLKLNGDYDALNLSGMALITDSYCPAGTIYMTHVPSLAWVDARDWGAVQLEDSGSWRWVQGRDAFETNYGMYFNVATVQRNAHGLITGYTDTARYTFIMS